MEKFGKFTAIVLVMIIAPIINGLVVTKLWGWFIVPTFEMNPLRIVEAIGIVLLITFIRSKREKSDSDNFWEDFSANVVFTVIMTAFVLLAGWVVQLFM